MKKEYICPQISIVVLTDKVMYTTDSTGDPNGYEFDAKENYISFDDDNWSNEEEWWDDEE